MRLAIQAIALGVTAVARAPATILVIYMALLAVVLPAAGIVAAALESSFDGRALERVMPGQADAAWIERAGHATRSASGNTLSPAIVGFAAQIANVADLIEGRSGGPIAVVPFAAWFVVWTLLLGGVLHRFARGTAVSSRAFLTACGRHFPPFAALAIGTLLVYAVGAAVYRAAPVNVRPWLLVPLIAGVGVATLIASYARARVAIDDANVRVAVASSVRLLRSTPLAVVTHAGAALAAWGVLMGGLAGLELAVGAGGSWRPVLVAQVYLAARIVLRLIWEASAVALVRMHLPAGI